MSLSVFSDTLTPTEIAEILDGIPVDSHFKGDPISPRYPEGKRRESHMWSITYDTDPELPFEEHLACMIDFVDEKQEQFLQLQGRCDRRIFGSSSVVHRSGFDLSVDELVGPDEHSARFDLKAPNVA